MPGNDEGSSSAGEEQLNQVMNKLDEQSKLIAKLLADAESERKAAEAQRKDADATLASAAEEIAALKAAADKDSDNDGDDLLYCGHSAENPFPRRPINAPLKPHSYDLYGDRTADILEKKKNSSLA